jgi:hypothetical protein
VISADNKKQARLNCISHLLSRIDYESQTEYPYIALPHRGSDDGYLPPSEPNPYVERVGECSLNAP